MLTQYQTDWAAQMESERIFQLIDSVLPFEACLYYQVLPLSLEGSIFKLGIVDPQDHSALDYVRRLLAYMNCSVVTQPISSEAQRSMLSAYLFHTSQPQEGAQGSSQPASVQERRSTLEETAPAKSAAPLGLPTPKVVPPPASQPTQPEAASQLSSLPVLEVQASHCSSPVEVLATLSPHQLLQELLGRILDGGIGRLYFERQQSQGRILWSQDGILKSVLESLGGPVFQGVIDELKRLTQLPLMPVEHPKQVEIERVYKQTHLLLRLRVMPGNYGEEATLQVLRGAALRFYQQQQLSVLNQDAMRLAEQLQRKVNEIRDRTRLAPTLVDISALELLLKSVDEQLETLIAEHKTDQPNSDSEKQD